MELSLTDRQLEILQLKARRFTNAEIAEQLVISITTVKWHVRQIYNKFGVNNRSEAVAFARQAGLLEQKQQQMNPFRQQARLHTVRILTATMII